MGDNFPKAYLLKDGEVDIHDVGFIGDIQVDLIEKLNNQQGRGHSREINNELDTQVVAIKTKVFKFE
jgi:hypothetical protein